MVVTCQILWQQGNLQCKAERDQFIFISGRESCGWANTYICSIHFAGGKNRCMHQKIDESVVMNACMHVVPACVHVNRAPASDITSG